MATEAQRRAQNEYRKRSTKQVIMRFYPKDAELYDYIKGKQNINEYLRGLVMDEKEGCTHMSVCKEWYSLLTYAEVDVEDFEEFCAKCPRSKKVAE